MLTFSWDLVHIIFFPFVLLRQNPKIVHIAVTGGFVFWEDAIYLIISKFFKKKILLHYLGSFDIFYDEAGETEKVLIKSLLKKCDIIAVLSLKVQKLVESIVLDNPKVILIPSSINFDHFNNNNLLFPKDDKVRILFLGGFDAYKKGIIDVIKIIPSIVESNPNVIFIIGSSKKLNLNIKQQYSSNIHFIDWIPLENKIPLLNSCDIFLLPSYDEGLPYSMIEAMAAGLPIISTYIGGIPEVVKPNNNGFLFIPGDIVKMKEYILQLVNDRELRIKFGKLNRELIKENYSLSKNMKIINDIYNNLRNYL